MKVRSICRRGVVLLLSSCLSGCFGDPVYSIRHSITFDGNVSHDCIVAAAANMGEGISIVKMKDEYGEREFDEYIVSDKDVEIEVLWSRYDRQKMEMSTFGIGYAEAERDAKICHLISDFEAALVTVCPINKQTLIVNDDFIRSRCPVHSR